MVPSTSTKRGRLLRIDPGRRRWQRDRRGITINRRKWRIFYGRSSSGLLVYAVIRAVYPILVVVDVYHDMRPVRRGAFRATERRVAREDGHKPALMGVFLIFYRRS